MKKSNERIQFITEYISAYENKIKLLNSNGLFDAAKLFELFAIEVGSLYFGQRFNNLNIETYTYPCVDLISADEQTYIQVSTAKYIPAKIKTTLEHIRDSKRVEINTIASVKFFMLNNYSADKVKDYAGNDQIGDISFIKANDLITTEDILQKAITDLNFQSALYELLKKETESIKDNSYKFQEAVENSKTVGLGNIDCKINNEYEIDRSEIISKIKAGSHKNISIQGGAGSGKSVLCKKIVEGEANLIYARAERFREEKDINDIWGFNVRQTLEYLNGKPIVFFIDALEFIADIRTKIDLLCLLYECTKEYPAAKVITSCRTSDKNAFVKIESNYLIYSYEVPELTIAEQSAIAKECPIINKMLRMNSYAELLKSPFYINLMVSKIADIDNISDENQLREHIWQYIICLNDNKIKEVVESIVFTRAKDFSLGAVITDYDTETINTLLSESVLVSNGNTVRLKYDIFEDICFEQYLDNEFNKCKGRYNEFFSKIETFGRCIYRRYQIWISNKLLAKSNRERFLFELVFSAEMPKDWRKQTEIGLVKSRYCGQFFSEYGQAIVNNGMLNDFIKTTNLYAFEINNDFLPVELTFYVQLRPSGEGRGSLINLIKENKLHEKNEILRLDLEKICTDYSNVQLKEKRTAEEACNILEYIIDKYMCGAKSYYKLAVIVNNLLESVYKMAEYSKEWIKEFWGRVTSYYKGDNKDKERLAEDIIKDTLKFKHTKPAEHLPMELCDLAEMFWTYSPEKNHNQYGFDFYKRNDMYYLYGLSEKAVDYEHESVHNNATDSNFFRVLFKNNFWTGLNWAIDFVNKAVLELAEKHEGGLPTYEINFIEDNIKKSYQGLPDMWLVTTQEHKMPTVISDLIYCLKEELRSVIGNDVGTKEETAKFVKNVNKLIYEKSNNIALLTIIADIGMDFRQKLPGCAVDLATNINIILHDLTRLPLLINDPVLEMLEKQIFMTAGLPSSLPDRYSKKDIKQYGLLDYVIESQINYGEEIKIKCHKILDYLYSIIPNDEEDATKYLQIQKMDLRTAKFVKIDDKTIKLIPTVTGEAKKIAIENEKQMQPESSIASIINCCNKKISKGEFKLNDCLKAVDVLLEIRKDCISGVCDKHLIDFFVLALNDKTLDNDIRSIFCQTWIDGIKSYFSKGSFIFEYSHSEVLFAQTEANIPGGVKNQIKQLILDLILYKEENAVIKKIADFAKQYMTTNEQLAISVFNTIVKLAEDGMNHRKFNAEYIKEHMQKEKLEFSLDASPNLLVVDFFIEEDKEKGYKSRRDEIIREYLFNDAKLDLPNFDMDNYDITTLCYAVNCGLSLDDNTFVVIVKKFFMAMINVWKTNEKTHHLHDILGVHPLYEVRVFFQRELVASEVQASIVLDILFTGIDFSIFTSETINFYLNVLGILLPEYFDSHSDKDRRANCERIIRSLESQITAIKEEWVKMELYKSLILSGTEYSGSGDWSKLPSGYSYKDKQFLNDLFRRYGVFHLKEMLSTIYKLHLNKLLPEILLSVRDAFKSALRTNESSSDAFAEIVQEWKTIVLMMITKAYLDFSDQIKQDDDLTKAYEEILEMLTEINCEEAATILDEFRVH